MGRGGIECDCVENPECVEFGTYFLKLLSNWLSYFPYISL
jgi:hypothetical protein